MAQRTPTKAAVHAFKKELILQAACEAFYDKGYARATLDDIARALDVTKPFIYYHFTSKQHLLEEICGNTSAFAADLAEQAQASDAEPFLDRLTHFIRCFALRVIEERMFLAIYFRESSHLPAQTQERLWQDRKRFHLALSALLKQGQQAGVLHIADLSITEQTLTGMVVWIFNWYKPQGPAAPEALAERMVEMGLAMLGVRHPDRG